MLFNMNRDSAPKKQLPFLVIAIVLMVGAHFFIFGGEKPYVTQAREELQHHDMQEQITAEISELSQSAGDVETGAEAEQPVFDTAFFIPDVKNVHVQTITAPEDRKLWQENAAYVFARPEWPKIVIIIDDLGPDLRHSRQVIWLPGPLTLSFLPYAKQIKRLVKIGHEGGHELMVHIPMEPVDGTLDTGPIVLKSDQSPAEFEEMLDKALNAFDGYVGINNHMGSKLTQDTDAMRMLMAKLFDLGLIFVDSRTIETTVAAKIAAEYQLPHASRDVFLDHDESLEAVRASLQKLENIARKHGYAIAIGHPKENTIKALREWLPTLEDKKLTLVPVSMVVSATKLFASSDETVQSPSPPLQ